MSFLQTVQRKYSGSVKYRVVSDDKKPIEHTVKITLTLAEAAKALGHKKWCEVNDYLDADAYDDVYHNGYTEEDALSFSVKGMDDVEQIFPGLVANAAEDAERDAYVVAIAEARREALVDSLEAVHVSAEYMSGDGEMISLGGAGVQSATIKNDTIEVVIENPEHLINDIVNGMGYFAPPFDPYEKASESEIKSYLLANINDYFDVYGDSKPDGELDDRFSPNIDAKYMAGLVKDRCADLSLQEVTEAVMDAVSRERLSKDEAINLAAKYSEFSKDQIKNTVKDL